MKICKGFTPLKKNIAHRLCADVLLGGNGILCKNKRCNFSCTGFTLIEMIVVVIVLGILASVTGVQYSKIIERSRGAEAKQVLLTAYAGYQRRVAGEESVAWATISDNWGKLGMSVPSVTYFTYSWVNTGLIPRIGALRVGDPAKNITVYLDNGTLVVTPPY